MSATVLSRITHSTIQHPTSADLQRQVDGIVTHFIDEATNPVVLASLTMGSLAYRMGRLGVMGSSVVRSPGWSVVRGPLSVVAGLGSEVTAFELTHRTLLTIAGGHAGPPLQNSSPFTFHSSPLWSWSGPGGWAQGLTSSVLTFGLLKGAGFLSREQNIVLQHMFQSTAMVVGHQGSALVGFTPRPQGSLAEQFLHAEITNLQLGAGTSLGHSLTGGRLMALERGLDLSLSFSSRGNRISGFPSYDGLALAVPEGRSPVRLPQEESPRERTSNAVLMSAENPEGGGGPGEAHEMVFKTSGGLHMRPSQLIVELLHHYPGVRLSVKRQGSTEDPLDINPQAVMDILMLEVHAGETLEWRAEGEKAEELLTALRYYNDNHWTAALGSSEAISVRRIAFGNPRRIIVAVSHAMDELKEEVLSGIYHPPTQTLAVGRPNFDHASLARAAGFESILDVSRLVFERTGSLIRMSFPPDDSQLENVGGHLVLGRNFPELLQGIDLKKGIHRLIPVSSAADIPPRYRQSPIGRLLEYHNLQRPFGSYNNAACLIGMCMDFRKMLRLPDRFAFVIRPAGANFGRNEFDLSMAVAFGNLSTLALIGHTNCKAEGLGLRRQVYVEGLVRNAGWTQTQAEEYFDRHAPALEKAQEVDFLLKESRRLRAIFPRLHIVPLLFRVEDGRLYLLREDLLSGDVPSRK